MQWPGSTNSPKAPRSSPRFAGTSPYFWVAAKWRVSSAAATAGCGWLAANVSTAGATCDSGTTQARIALSGQALTQAMQPTHMSISTSGIRGASRLKSRVADVPGGMMLRARPASAGNSASAMPRR